jgi:acyl carrier protein
MDGKIKQIVTDILVNKIGLEESEITADANFTKDLGIDSLDYAELVMEFEQAFDIKINDEETEGLNTIGDFVRFIKAKVNNKN